MSRPTLNCYIHAPMLSCTNMLQTNICWGFTRTLFISWFVRRVSSEYMPKPMWTESEKPFPFSVPNSIALCSTSDDRAQYSLAFMFITLMKKKMETFFYLSNPLRKWKYICSFACSNSGTKSHRMYESDRKANGKKMPHNRKWRRARQSDG